MNKLWLIIIAVVLAGGGLAWYLVSSGDKNSKPTADTQQTSKQQTTKSEPGSATTSPAVEEAKLVAVNNYEGSGTATRTISGKYVHNVTAKIGSPAEGKFYEGWLVGPTGFISTGKLTQEVAGPWSLIYTSDDNLSSYNKVVITEETEANGLDNKPETHVLEGQF